LVAVGQLTPLRTPRLPVERLVHVKPPSAVVSTIPPAPTAIQTDVVGQLTPAILPESTDQTPDDSFATTPSVPPARQSEVGQLTVFKSFMPVPAFWVVHVAPSEVIAVQPPPPTTVQLVTDEQLMPFIRKLAAIVCVDQVVPPFAVLSTDVFDTAA
jgi:hypothetical protein